MDELTIKTSRNRMYLCSNVLGDNRKGEEDCARNLFEFGNKKRQFITFSKHPGVKVCATPPGMKRI